MTSTAKPDYWSLLGLPPGSDQVNLKRAFRREARKWHPDLNGNDINAEERFKLVNEAYAVLSDPKKKLLWEESQGIKRSIINNFEHDFPTFSEYIQIVLGIEDSDVHSFEEDQEENNNFEERFNRPVESDPPPPPVQVYEDIESIIELKPEEALLGAEVQIELENGTIVEIRTPSCAGDGWRLRLPGIALGGRDHFLQLKVQTEEGLRIDGLRVLYRLELFPPDAVLGCAVDIPTLNGPVTLQVPPESSSGRLLRLRGRGLEFEGVTGDQIVEISVVIPAEIRDDERALYERLQELSLENDKN
tara:strand:+ start:455 stop:1363 length:909 start_codon:yes stop_codon:yes gene_type:complete